MKALIFDTETTNTEDTAEIIEAACLPIFDDGTEQPGAYLERFRPEGEISLGAMATHHILPSDLAECRPSAEFSLPDADFLIGHNIDFDWKVAGSPDVKCICTLALARHLWPELDSHKQGALMYFLFGEEARERVKAAHCALDDILMCADIFDRIVCELAMREIPCDTFDEIWQASEVARVPTVMSFGKHKGLPITEVPIDYFDWYLRQTDQDEYYRRAFLDEIQRRRS